MTVENTDETVETESAPVTSDISGIMDDMAGSMSEPSPHAIEQAQREADEVAQHQQKTDKRGDTFNPDVHAVDDDGSPKLTAAGNFAKRRGRKLGQTSNVSVVSSPGQPKQVSSQQEQMTAQAAVSGRSAAGLLFTLGCVIGGEEWQPMVDKATGLDERAMLEKAFADYFLSTGKTDIPPGWALTIAVGAYAAPRFTAPKTKLRAKNFFGKLRLWYKNRKLDKETAKAEKADEIEA